MSGDDFIPDQPEDSVGSDIVSKVWEEDEPSLVKKLCTIFAEQVTKSDHYVRIWLKAMDESKKYHSGDFKSSDELRYAMEKFVCEVVFPFAETPLNEIRKELRSLPEENRKPDEMIDEVRASILKFAGIEDIPAENGITIFDPYLHDEYAKDTNSNFKDRVVLKVVKKGYRIA